ncbi:FAD-dependent monooxygenase [Actinomadura litoris]|uniref:Monooxygenase n=1 Tax=Actinomadura litoris TaxID=2678616 RepID=A0A7K1KX32_9ACTN|nr:FAD-dependent monooxygenase [Actinomadura litoris]MUN36760.1 monooxygenase [Actinomadura litoris]
MNAEESTSVVVVGGGPTGMMLAGELRLAGVDVVLLERIGTLHEHTHSMGLHPRAAEALDQRGLMDRFGGPLPKWPRLHFGLIWLDVEKVGEDEYTLASPDWRAEEILEERAVELGADVRRGHRATSLRQDGSGVTLGVSCADGDYEIRCSYLVGCDGPDSPVREMAGFDVTESTLSYYGVFGDFKVAAGESPEFDTGLYADGMTSVLPFGDGLIRVMSVEFDRRPPAADVPLSKDELLASLRRASGEEPELGEPERLFRYGGPTRHADGYRKGRVFLAGEAAHAHFVHAAHGKSTGIHDALNLAWKLGAELNGWAPPGLLDSYDAERRPVGDRACLHGEAQLAVFRSGRTTSALRELMAELIRYDEVNRQLITQVTDVRYPLGSDAAPHPLVGARVPNTLLAVKDERPLAAGCGVLYDLSGSEPDQARVTGWADRVDVVAAEPHPGLDAAALLVRPDGFVAWATPGDGVDTGLREALTRWFGEPTS